MRYYFKRDNWQKQNWHTLTKSKVAEHSRIGTSWQEGSSERFMLASSFIGSIRCRLMTADELKSMTPLQPGKIYHKTHVLNILVIWVTFQLLECTIRQYMMDLKSLTEYLDNPRVCNIHHFRKITNTFIYLHNWRLSKVRLKFRFLQ